MNILWKGRNFIHCIMSSGLFRADFSPHGYMAATHNYLEGPEIGITLGDQL